MKEASLGGTLRRVNEGESRKQAIVMLHAGLDLSRKRLDSFVLDPEGGGVGGRGATGRGTVTQTCQHSAEGDHSVLTRRRKSGDLQGCSSSVWALLGFLTTRRRL
jgi:hypothetical protein